MRCSSPANGQGPWPGSSSKVVLIATCVLVDAMAPLLQEQASKSFPGSLMVLAETLTYFFGGLSLAMALEGLQGMRRCLQPLRYLAFMPASLAYSWAGFMTYPAIKVRRHVSVRANSISLHSFELQSLRFSCE